MHNHIGYICATFLRCVFSSVSSSGLPVRMHNYIDCICLAFLHCALSNVKLNALQDAYSHWLQLFDFLLCPLFVTLVAVFFIVTSFPLKLQISEFWSIITEKQTMDGCRQHSCSPVSTWYWRCKIQIKLKYFDKKWKWNSYVYKESYNFGIYIILGNSYKPMV